MGAQGLLAFLGRSHQELRCQEQVPVLMQSGVRSRGNSAGTNDGGPPPQAFPRYPEQLAGAKHPGLGSHHPAQGLTGERLTPPTEVGRPAPTRSS